MNTDTSREPTEETDAGTTPGPYSDAIKFALIYQLVLGILAGMILDSGQCKQYWFVSMLAFWGSIAVVALRQTEKPTKLDLLWVKWGFFPVLLVVPQLMAVIWRWRGVQPP